MYIPRCSYDLLEAGKLNFYTVPGQHSSLLQPHMHRCTRDAVVQPQCWFLLYAEQLNGSCPATDSPVMLTTYCVITPFLSSGGGGCHLSMRAVEFTSVAERDVTNPGTADLRMRENWNNTQGFANTWQACAI